MSASANKQRLDELLGIVSEMQKSDSGMRGFINEVTAKKPDPIPDDVPGEVSDIPKTEDVIASASVPSASSPGATTAAAATGPGKGGAVIDRMLEEQDNMAMVQTNKSLGEIDELLNVSKQVVQHVYNVVTSTDILDASTITACATLIKETKALIQEHLEIQRSQREFLNKVQMEEIKHQHQMQLMEKKFELEQKRMQAKKPPIATSGGVQPVAPTGGMKAYSSADLMKMINEE